MNDLASNTPIYKSSCCECDGMVYQVVLDCHRSWILHEYFIEYVLSTMFCISDTDKDIKLVNEADFVLSHSFLFTGVDKTRSLPYELFTLLVIFFVGNVLYW